jgi:hypothetical protein
MMNKQKCDGRDLNERRFQGIVILLTLLFCSVRMNILLEVKNAKN